MRRHIINALNFYWRQILVCFLAGAFILAMAAFCATSEEVEGATGMVKTIYGMIDDIFDISAMDDLRNLLVVDFNGGTLKAGGITFHSLMPVVSTMHRTFQNLGVMFLIVFFGVGVLESLSFNQMYIEKMVRQFVFLCIGIVLVSKSMELVFGIGNVFSALIDQIVRNAAAGNVDMSSGIMALKQAIYDDCHVSTGTGFKAAIADSVSNLAASVSYVIQLFIPSLISKLANVVVSVVCWSRFIELVLINSVQETIIDECVHALYGRFMEDGKLLREIPGEEMPTLTDLQVELAKRREPEARELAMALKLYTGGGSLNAFGFSTNVEIHSRFVVYQIRDVGDRLKNLSMLTILDHIWNQIVYNRKIGKNTWFYVDEIYLLFQNEYSATFLNTLFRRARKYGGVPTGITQNVRPVLESPTARDMLQNCSFIEILGQAGPDRDALKEILNLSDTEVEYITNSPKGQGIYTF